MKLDGREIRKCNQHTIVIPRSDGDSIVLIAQAVLDYSGFEELCPIPKPPIRMKAGGEKIANFQDPRYMLANRTHAARRVAWIVLESLRLGTPGLEWERIDYGNPNTWEKYDEELRESGFTHAEIMMIVNGCFIANALDEHKIEEARNSFLAGQQALAEESSFQEEETNATPSGELASE